MNTKNKSLSGWVMAGLAAILAGGCTNRPILGPNEDLPNEVQAREKVTEFNRTQYAQSAKEDGMLFPSHFDGEQLNSLGREKLDLMIRAPEGRLPLVVYVDIVADEHATAKSEAVAAYLKSRGLTDDQFRLEIGANSQCVVPALQGFKERADFDSNSMSADSGSGGASSGSSSSGSK